ncbi:MAG TPA: hypothetical protein VG672_05050 [Bryobacteraceae bacterium]|nr:hypothetical protein [Bryobacteraceae bacterium]
MIMLRGVREISRNLIVGVLVASLGLPSGLSAQSHIVSPTELQSAVAAAAQARQKNAETVVSLFSTPAAEKALRSTRLDVNQVKTAVSSLSDEELARFAARAEKAQADLVAGRLAERDLLWILVGLAALILIIVAVR